VSNTNAATIVSPAPPVWQPLRGRRGGAKIF